jgi:hypothetical protein
MQHEFGNLSVSFHVFILIHGSVAKTWKTVVFSVCSRSPNPKCLEWRLELAILILNVNLY